MHMYAHTIHSLPYVQQTPQKPLGTQHEHAQGRTQGMYTHPTQEPLQAQLETSKHAQHEVWMEGPLLLGSYPCSSPSPLPPAGPF